MQRVHHLAIDVDLHLLGRGVVNAHRLGALIAVKPWHFPLEQPVLAGDGVHDLNAVGRTGNRAEEPFAPGARVFIIAGIHQCDQREGGVAQPAKPVIPIALAAQPLRQ
jgi:hypothetical protein